MKKIGRNSAPVAAGIHDSPTTAIKIAPTDFTKPLATTYAHDSPAPRISDVRRPSRKLNTMPHTVPSGKPFRNSAITLPPGGSTANATSAASANRISQISDHARRPAGISELNLIPRNFDSAYPASWLMTSAPLRSRIQKLAPSKGAAANGLRKLYIAKYVVNAIATAYVANSPGPARVSQRVAGFDAAAALIETVSNCERELTKN